MSPPPPTFTHMNSAPRHSHSLVYIMHTCVSGLCLLSTPNTHDSDAKAPPLTMLMNNASRVCVCLLSWSFRNESVLCKHVRIPMLKQEHHSNDHDKQNSVRAAS